MNIIRAFNRWPISRKISFLWTGMAVVVAIINGVMVYLSMAMKNLQAVSWFAVFVIASVVIGTAISLRYVQWLMKPVSILSRHVEQMAQGDFSQDKVAVRAEDDLGQLARSLETMTGEVRKMIQGMQEAADSVSLSSQQLSASAEEVTHSAEVSADRTQGASEAAASQESQAQAALEQLKEAAGKIQEMSRFSEELYADSEEAAQLAGSSKERAFQAAERVRDFQQAIHDVSAVMHELESDVERIVETMSQIQDVAAQTNLLALNASIEAARAGDAGKGFEVVAQEVRSLADESKVAAESIVSLVETIHARVTKAGTMMNKTQSESETFAAVVEESRERFGKFAEDASQRAQSARAGTQTMHEVEASATLSAQTLQGMAELAQTTADTLETIAGQAQQQVATMEEVASSADTLNSLASELRRVVRQFRTGN